MKRIIQKSFLLVSLVVFNGCDETKQDTTTYLCPTENALEVNALTLNVHDNTFDTTTKLLEDMNKTLLSFDKVNNGNL
ncbi:hypothetical protein [Sulfurimonas sp.]|uniref:hypothetical protein n=1 Tax=Sulfurimonas sp. TaxID=2022749 RepID=UPI00261B533B|nr:hypothetical protein [Sulfurimonas sp.]